MKIDSCFRKFYQTTTSTIAHMLHVLDSLLHVTSPEHSQTTQNEPTQTTLSERMRTTPNQHINTYQRDDKLSKINSVRQLQLAIDKLENHSQENESENLDSSTVLVYFKWYLDNLEYIKRLLKIFIDNIFNPLLTDKHKLENGLVLDLGICHSLAKYEASELTLVIEELKTNTNHLLPSRVYRMKGTCHCENTEQAEESMNVKLDSFFIESLTKLQTACTLARGILHKKRSSTDADLRTLFKESARKKALANEIKDLSKSVAENEKDIECLTQDLQMLWVREKRTDELESNILETHRTIASLTKTIQTRNLEEKSLMMDLHLLESESAEYKTTLAELHAIRLEQLTVKTQIRTLEYKHNLYQEDLAIEYSLKPDIVRFSDNVQDKIETLENKTQEASQKMFELETMLGF
ncbi:unnamed protein product [Owenia fusiformis]|uniref:Uncharacterized protein n=1 Tax=Owenia fusiformis TaxID=6347 RepID=A0A8S4PXG7_OWEFU|nr:unnamed protein product [Owenia fusiformis]